MEAGPPGPERRSSVISIDVRYRIRPWLVLLLLAGVCVSIIALVAHLRSRRHSTAALLARLPSDDAVILSIDFEALRRAGMLDALAGPDALQEPEYRVFVADSGFNYREDLDLALVSFHRTGAYFVLRGRFNWKVLGDYVVRQGGSCYNSLCQMAGSTPERKISYYPLHSNLMALAVAKDEQAALELGLRRSGRPQPSIPSQPVWAFIPGSVLKKAQALPAGARAFARLLEGAEALVLTLGVQGNRLEVLLEVTCRSGQEAASLVSQLEKTTSLLRELIARENQQPNPRDLSGVLTAGVFRQQDGRVIGRWPVERGFLEALTGGAL